MIETLVQIWPITLGVSMLFFAVAVVLQVKKMNSFHSDFAMKSGKFLETGDMGAVMGTAFKGALPILLCVLLSGLSGILFLIGVIVAVIRAVQAG